MARDPIPTWYFAVVVVRHEDRYLLVHERKHGQLWYLPAGRVEPGETLAAGAVRETLEETGVAVTIDGVLRVEHSPRHDGARLRVLFAASPAGDPTPKSEPDEHSLEARWFSVDELASLPLRGPEVARILREVASGAPVYPTTLIAYEGAPLLGSD